jgi:Spy/CpxP family protein refolding chaperone
MKRWLGIALAASLALNVGVIAAAGYQAWRIGGLQQASYFGMPHEDIPSYLGLSAEQRAKWHALEEGFLAELERDAREIRAHREWMIRMIFGEQPDPATIEAARAAIFALQERQQRRIIGQLLKEREMLAPEQRAKLAELLIRQAPVSAGTPERIHAK